MNTARECAVAAGIASMSMLYDVARKDDTQLYWLYDLAAMAPDGIAVECGVHRGGSLVCWAAVREGRGEIVAVDYKFRPGFRIHVELFGLSPRLIERTSWEAAAELAPDSVAFCFIDADHGETGIPRDIAVWPDRIMHGGILCFHDFHVWKPGVVVEREVMAWQEREPWEPLGLVGSLIAFRRPG